MHDVPPSAVPSPSRRLLIQETFYSIQGEGLLAGTPSVFIRTTGCGLRCVWCDSPLTSWRPEGQWMAVESLVEWAVGQPTRHAVLTGGEPLLQPGILPLCRRFREEGFHVTVETAAIVDRPIECDLASISPKLSNSTPHRERSARWSRRHESERLKPEIIRSLMGRSKEYQLKFVVSSPEDMAEITELLAALGAVRRERILLMPEGVDERTLHERGRWVAAICKREGYRFCPRLHIELFGHTPGT